MPQPACLAVAEVDDHQLPGCSSNVWDDTYSSQQDFYTHSDLAAVEWNMGAAYYASAATCHRFDGRRSNTTLRGGWNKVTPWAKKNDGTNADHKGAYDPNYSTRTSN